MEHNQLTTMSTKVAAATKRRRAFTGKLVYQAGSQEHAAIAANQARRDEAGRQGSVARRTATDSKARKLHSRGLEFGHHVVDRVLADLVRLCWEEREDATTG